MPNQKKVNGKEKPTPVKRFPSVPPEEFTFAINIINNLLSGKAQSDDPAEYAILLPDGTPFQLDGSINSRIYLTLRKELDHLTHDEIMAAISRHAIIEAVIATTDSSDKFAEHVSNDKQHITEELLKAIARFPMWVTDRPTDVLQRLHKFLYRPV